MTDAWDFKDQLVVGDRGQELFIQYYHEPLVIYPPHKADFQVVSSSKLLELKTDTYNIEKTPYFFMERWSDVHQEKPGGPWQSKKNKVDLFCYMFVRHNIYFEFTSIPALCKELDGLTAKMGLVYIKNKGWVTAGYKVPRDALKHLYKEYQFEIKS